MATLIEMIDTISIDEKQNEQIIGVYISGFTAGQACAKAGLPSPINHNGMVATYKAIDTMLINEHLCKDFLLLTNEMNNTI